MADSTFDAMSDDARVGLEEALSVGLSSLYANNATPAEPIRALAHQLLDYADNGRKASEPATPRARVLLENMAHLSSALSSRRAAAPPPPLSEPGDKPAVDGWSVAGWVESLKLDELVTSALHPPAGAEAQVPFAHALTFERAQQMLARAGIERQLATALARSADELRGCGADASVSGLNAKFAVESSFELSVGSLEVDLPSERGTLPRACLQPQL